jgi:hypothetical protein
MRTVVVLENTPIKNHITGPQDNIITEKKYAVTEDGESWQRLLRRSKFEKHDLTFPWLGV